MAKINKPYVIDLGRMFHNLQIGYRILTINRRVYTKFTTDGVIESSISGTYYIKGGVDVPVLGGYIVVGTPNLDMVESTIEPEIVIPDITSTLTTLINAIQSINYQPVITNEIYTDTTQFDNTLLNIKSTISEIMLKFIDTNRATEELISTKVDELIVQINELDKLNDSLDDLQRLHQVREMIDKLLPVKSIPAQEIKLTVDNESDALVDTLVQSFQDKLNERSIKNKETLNKFLSRLDKLK